MNLTSTEARIALLCLAAIIAALIAGGVLWAASRRGALRPRGNDIITASVNGGNAALCSVGARGAVSRMPLTFRLAHRRREPIALTRAVCPKL